VARFLSASRSKRTPQLREKKAGDTHFADFSSLVCSAKLRLLRTSTVSRCCTRLSSSYVYCLHPRDSQLSKPPPLLSAIRMLSLPYLNRYWIPASLHLRRAPHICCPTTNPCRRRKARIFGQLYSVCGSLPTHQCGSGRPTHLPFGSRM